MHRYILAIFPVMLVPAEAQVWDLPSRAATALTGATENNLKFSFEQRGRYEERGGNAFGKDPDVATGLYRTRVGMSYSPRKWFRISAMMQDARSPWYGPNAPSSVRDPADLQEGYVELGSPKKGFGVTAGRRMLNYGQGRLIGTPQWGNLSRTFDHARMYWRSPRAQFEVLLASIVKVRIDEFNRPVLGDRVWGTYNVFPDLFGSNSLETYILRHDQNRPGGFTGGSAKDGAGSLGVNTFGSRIAGPLSGGLKYSMEGAWQTGKVGPATLRSRAFAALAGRRWKIGSRAFDLLVEYKYASGSDNPADTRHSGTFDQLYAANHDRFGHQDLFGWRNIHNSRAQTTLGLNKYLALNFMYDNYWLASAKDGIYSASGKLIARSAAGAAGRHVGQEADVFATCQRGHFTFGAGYGYFISGEFIRKTTPGVGPTYIYVFHSYTL